MISPSAFLYGSSQAVSHASAGTPAKVVASSSGADSRGIYKGVYKLCAHPHAEMNYRKKPMGFKAYKKADPFLPFQLSLPRRHAECVYPGMWHGAGHFHPVWTYKYRILQTLTPIAGGFALGFTFYMSRMRRNGWTIKNKGAVSGTD